MRLYQEGSRSFAIDWPWGCWCEGLTGLGFRTGTWVEFELSAWQFFTYFPMAGQIFGLDLSLLKYPKSAEDVFNHCWLFVREWQLVLINQGVMWSKQQPKSESCEHKRPSFLEQHKKENCIFENFRETNTSSWVDTSWWWYFFLRSSLTALTKVLVTP